MENLNEPRVKGVADIVFVLDYSKSMSDIIDSLREYIGDFVEMLLNDPQSGVHDLRLGLVTHDAHGFPFIWNTGFLSTAEEFRRALKEAPEGGSELGLPAVDVALDFPWREKCRRYIVFISDEPVSGGHMPDIQNSKLKDLCEKMAALKVRFLGYNQVDCPSYRLLGKTPGSSFEVVSREELVGPRMKELLKTIAKTVSDGYDQAALAQVKRNIYGITEGEVPKEWGVSDPEP